MNSLCPSSRTTVLSLLFFFFSVVAYAQTIHVVDGKVGIGTNTPGATLDVIRPSNPNVYENGIRANRPDSQGQYAFMGYGQSSADAYFGSVYTGSAGSYGRIFLRQYTQGMTARDALVIDSNGNVGIGTTGPTFKLHVAGSGFAQLNPDDGSLELASGNDNYSFIDFRGNANLAADFRGRIGYGDGVGFDFMGAGALAMRITDSGNVGIGTSNPSLGGGFTPKLQLSGPYAAMALEGGASGKKWGLGIDSNGALDIFESSAGYSGRLLITNSGNVGIGSTSPQEKLVVGGNILLNPADKYLKIFANTEGVDSIVFARSDNSHQASIATTAFGKSILFKVGGGEIVRFRNDGNVGIGTTNPTHKLTVNGQVKAKGFLADTSNWADFVFEPGYPLAPLAEVEAHIRDKGHLPGIPSAVEVKEQGVDLMAMQVKLLQKVEELTLHLIRMEKENATLRQRVQALEGNR